MNNIDAAFEAFLAPIANFISSIVFFSVPVFGVQFPLIVAWLVVAGVFFTIYMRFLAWRGMKHAFDLVSGKYDRPNADGEVTHFQALSTALTNTLGLGNIAGVALAITLGGPGAVFWMVLAGCFAMATKMVECTLGVKYRKVREDGTISGGPMYYLKRGFVEIGKPRLGNALAYIYAVCMTIAFLGLMTFQSNQAAAQVVNVTTGGVFEFLNGNRWLIGVFMAVLGALVIFGSVKKIAKAASIMIPFMSATYILSCITVIVVNFSALPEAISTIVAGAFNPQGVAGGFLGVLIIGFQRAAFSNAAGVGDAPVAHSVVKTDRPPTEGFVAALEPFVDTICVNVVSALAVVVTGAYLVPGLSGVEITSAAFGTVAPWFTYVLAVAVFLFAVSAILAFSYFGAKSLGFLFGDKNWIENIYKALMLLFTVIGTAGGLGAVVTLADSMLFLMAVFNIIGLYFLAPIVRREFDDYWRRLKAGEFEADRTDRKKPARTQPVA